MLISGIFDTHSIILNLALKESSTKNPALRRAIAEND